MSAIACVFFDYDGVLTTDRTGSLTTCRYLSRAAGIPLDRVRAAFAVHNEALTLGHITHDQVWPDICAALGRAIPIGTLEEAFDSTPANGAMFELARALQCRVGILTDNKADRMRRLRATQGLDRTFDPIVVSAEAGMSKSSPGFFEHALRLAAAAAHETVFIDNDRGNVDTAAGLGIHAVHFDDAVNDIQGLVRRLQEDFGLGPARLLRR
ncbi:HAD family hydrolase [Ramlibacter humi]|uniref:Haloacid dehalogenase n=1 Tax=Ramlibacter humi TaxID=2530451 RepID=A0A4Z0C0B6_9BURK|nr:HAD family hydrolase [Ramlibacter humi]TFZ03970.1 haloacid dehalogenase [Ramlibacter humi]